MNARRIDELRIGDRVATEDRHTDAIITHCHPAPNNIKVAPQRGGELAPAWVIGWRYMGGDLAGRQRGEFYTADEKLWVIR